MHHFFLIYKGLVPLERFFWDALYVRIYGEVSCVRRSHIFCARSRVLYFIFSCTGNQGDGHESDGADDVEGIVDIEDEGVAAVTGGDDEDEVAEDVADDEVEGVTGIIFMLSWLSWFITYE